MDGCVLTTSRIESKNRRRCVKTRVSLGERPQGTLSGPKHFFVHINDLQSRILLTLLSNGLVIMTCISIDQRSNARSRHAWLHMRLSRKLLGRDLQRNYTYVCIIDTSEVSMDHPYNTSKNEWNIRFTLLV